MKYHKTKDGKKIKLSDLETSHLENIIKWIERKSVDGLTVIYSGGGFDAEDMWLDEETFFGEKAKKELNFYDYVLELNRRNNNSQFANRKF